MYCCRDTAGTATCSHKICHVSCKYLLGVCGQLNVTVMCSKKRSDLTEFGMQNSEFGVRNADFGVKDSEFGLGQRHVR